MEEEDADEVEDDEESLGDEAIDLAQALDLASDSDGESGSAQSGSDDEGDDQFSSVSSDVDGDEADEADAEGLKKLYRTVNGMSTEAATAAPDEGPASGGRRKITLQDLGLDSVRDPHIKKSLKLMTKEEKAAKSGTSRKLDVPLARRQQDRLLRVAAYEKSTKTLDRWQETVKFNRRADHLVFPLPQEAPDAGLDNSELLQLNSKGLGSELQQTILSIMKDSGMGPKAPRASKQDEDEEQQAISAADLYDLVAEKRRRREMESREQARAKRIKKIKSKAYHRVHKRQRIREMEKAAEAEEQMAEAGEGEGAGAGAGVSFHEAKEEHDRRRAEARMGTKHRESKWGKRDSKSRRAAWDDEYRESVAVAARRDEELRRRIDGRDGGEESDDENASSGGDEDEDGDILKQIDELEKDDGQGEESRLMQMPFMKKAEEALKKQNQEALRQVRRELEGDAEESEEEATEVGRRNFGGPKAVVDSAAMADDDDGELQVTARPPKQKKSAAKNFLSRQERPIIAGPSSGNRENSKETGAWSTPSRPEHGKGSWNLRPVVSVGEPKPLRAKSKKSGPDATANRHPLPAMAPAGDGDSDRGSDDSDAEATRGSEPADPSAPPSSHMRPVGAEETKKLLLARLLDSGSDDDGDDGDDGDGAAAAFAAEKRAVAAEDDDQVVDDTLPGWGTWAGPGVTKRRQQRRFLSVVKGVKKKEDRRDARLDKVIINEKRVKKVGVTVCVFAFYRASANNFVRHRTTSTSPRSSPTPSSRASSTNGPCASPSERSGSRARPSRRPPSRASSSSRASSRRSRGRCCR